MLWNSLSTTTSIMLCCISNYATGTSNSLHLEWIIFILNHFLVTAKPMTVLKSTSSPAAPEWIHHQDWSKGTPKDFPLSCASPLVDQLSTPSVSRVCFCHLQVFYTAARDFSHRPGQTALLLFIQPLNGSSSLLGQGKPSHQLRGTWPAPSPTAQGLWFLFVCFLFFKYQKHITSSLRPSHLLLPLPG